MNKVRPQPYDSKVDSRGRIVIRKAQREHIGLPNGGRIALYENEDGQLAIRLPSKDEE
jgi:AbrB family looped-hinge helix DNA binding protein